MLNPEVLKCHEDLLTRETYVQQGNIMDNKFSYVKTLTSLSIWEPGGGGGGASIIRRGHLGSHLPSHVNIILALLWGGENRIPRKHHVSMHGVPSAAIIGSNYVRYDAETSPDNQYGIDT